MAVAMLETTLTPPNVVLDQEGMAPFLSDYLMRGGVQKDVAEIDEVRIAGVRVQATCHMKDWFTSPHDGTFHLSGVVGSTLLVQLGIIHGLVLEGHSRKDAEVFLSDYQMKCVREVTATEGLTIEMERIHRIVLPSTNGTPGSRSFCTWRFDVDGGAWKGRLTLVLPATGGGEKGASDDHA